jgi:hypothetical protein
MEKKQITHQKRQEAITPEKLKPLECDEMSITRAWIDCTWMSLTREERER